MLPKIHDERYDPLYPRAGRGVARQRCREEGHDQRGHDRAENHGERRAPLRVVLFLFAQIMPEPVHFDGTAMRCVRDVQFVVGTPDIPLARCRFAVGHTTAHQLTGAGRDRTACPLERALRWLSRPGVGPPRSPVPLTVIEGWVAPATASAPVACSRITRPSLMLSTTASTSDCGGTARRVEHREDGDHAVGGPVERPGDPLVHAVLEGGLITGFVAELAALEADADEAEAV